MSEKVVMRACDLVTLLVQPSEWNYGCKIPQVKLVGPCCHIESLTDRSSQYYNKLDCNCIASRRLINCARARAHSLTACVCAGSI